MNGRLQIAWCVYVAGAAAFAAGCQQKMADQPSLRPDRPISFLPGGTSSQSPVAGTVARGHLHTDWAMFTGRSTYAPPRIAAPSASTTSTATRGSAEARDTGNAQTLLAAELADFQNVVNEFPMPIDESFVEHGYHRYMIYCVVCHDSLGTGQGKIVERGYTRPPSYHIDRLRDAPVGHFFRVITEGYGSMPSYAAQIPPRDRWAIVAYIRALQFSQHCPADEAPQRTSADQQSQSAVSIDSRKTMNSISTETLKVTAPRETRRVMVAALAVGIIAGAIFILGGIFDPAQFFHAYLAAYLPCLNIAPGSLMLLMIYYITGGGWGFVTRRIFESCLKTLPLLAAGFVPVALRR